MYILRNCRKHGIYMGEYDVHVEGTKIPAKGESTNKYYERIYKDVVSPGEFPQKMGKYTLISMDGVCAIYEDKNNKKQESIIISAEDYKEWYKNHFDVFSYAEIWESLQKMREIERRVKVYTSPDIEYNRSERAWLNGGD